MSNELTTNPILHSFMDEEFGQIRIIIIDGKVYFFAKDISDILGYSDTQAMTRRLKDSEVRKIEADKVSGANPMAREFTLINESGFYRSIFGSTKDFAERFKDKVFEVILPTIRKTGSYSIAPPSLHNDILQSLQEVRQEKEHTTKVINKLLHFLTYAIDYRPNQESTNKAFSTIQNIIHIVATGFTAKELKLYRIDSDKIHCGSQNFKYGKNGRLDKTEAKVGRNYLSKKELEVEKQFVILILTALDIQHQTQGMKFSVQDFVEFVWKCADQFCTNRDIPEIASIALDTYIDNQVSRYNQNKALCDSGNKLFIELKNPNQVPVLS